jgi:hypothetical protein
MTERPFSQVSSRWRHSTLVGVQMTALYNEFFTPLVRNQAESRRPRGFPDLLTPSTDGSWAPQQCRQVHSCEKKQRRRRPGLSSAPTQTSADILHLFYFLPLSLPSCILSHVPCAPTMRLALFFESQVHRKQYKGCALWNLQAK